MSNGYIERRPTESLIQIVGLHKCKPCKIYQKMDCKGQVGSSIYVLIGNNSPSFPSNTKPLHGDYWNDAFLFTETPKGLHFLGTPGGEDWKESVFQEVSSDVKFVLHNTKAENNA